jgi:OOP family OmpA-OmpF porin
MGFAIRALGDLPRSKISVSASRVAITAMVDSAADQRRLESDLARSSPSDVGLALDISAPRPVITPFTLRFVLDDRVARFDACSADTAEARDRILGAAGRAGLREKTECTIGMGVPSPHWAKAVELAIAAVDDLGGGTVTFTDADIALRAPEDVSANRFNDIVGGLETALPEVFALKATLPEPADDTAPETAEFIATLSPEGQVLLRGQVGTPQLREIAQSLAKARFASDAVQMSARVAEDLPGDWSMRVLLGLEALSQLAQGAVTVTPETVAVSGKTGRKDAGSDLSALLSDKLGGDAQFTIDVAYDERLDPVAGIPTPAECEARIAAVQDESKIGFEPGSAQINSESIRTMDRIADILQECGELRMEIAGHTDSQGREEMNKRLSLERARTVLEELRLRRVLTSAIEANGYGESNPIADNTTEEGREQNRRIEFRVIRPEPVAEYDTALEPPDQTGDGDTGDTANAQDEAADDQD